MTDKLSLIESIVNENAVDFRQIVNKVLLEKLAVRLDEEYKYVSKNIFNLVEAEEQEEEEVEEEDVMEAVQLQSVKGLYGSKIGGDDGANPKSPTTFNSGQAGMDSKPVKFSGQAETVPTAPKAPSNSYAKGETQVKHAGQFKNAPGHKDQNLEKAPAAHKAQASGVNTKSPVAEAKKVAKKKI